MKDWPDADGNSGDDSTEDPPNNHPGTLAIDTRQDVGHIKLGKRPSDTCPHNCTVFNQSVNGLGGKQDDKLEKVISLTRERKIHAYCIQETWQLHNYMLTIRGYTVFHHGLNENPQHQGRTSAGVMIILNPALTQAWALAGKLKPVISSPVSTFPGRMIGVTLSFPNFLNRPTDTFKRKAKGSIKLFLCSIYHPHEFNKQREFYDELYHFITTRPRNSEILMGGRRELQCRDKIEEVQGYFGTARIG